MAPSGGPGYNRAFTYQGYLEEDGVPANSFYDLWFGLYQTETTSTWLADCFDLAGAEFDDIHVEDGFFTVSIICQPSNSEWFNGDNLWLQPWVSPAGTGTWTSLPRQPISTAPYAFSLIPGAIVRGGVASSSAALSVTQTYDASPSDSAFGIYGYGPDVGIYGESGDTGVQGFGLNTGVRGESGYIGVYGWSDGPTGIGVSGYATNVGVEGTGYYGVQADGHIAFRGYSNDGNLIELWDKSPSYNRRFYVSNAGDVYADGGYRCGNNINDSNGSGDLSETEIEPCLYDNWPADFAEVLPAAGEMEPGDVLVIGTDGQLAQSDTPYAANVMGVYSTRPSYVGGAQFLGQEGYAPLAVMGVVPVKASAENGPIVPGDLLVASSTPGHAMRAGSDPPVGTAIGKALEGLDAGTGMIQMMVTLQ